MVAVLADTNASSAGAALVRYRNRAITQADLDFIRRTIASDPTIARVALSETLCRAWDWRQANGEWAAYACRDLLLRLDEWGHLRLPPSGRRTSSSKPRREHPLLPRDLIALTGLALEPSCIDLKDLEVRPITHEERMGWRLYMGRYHPLGDRVIVGEHLLYVALLGGELVGLLAWASAAFRSPLRERFIGWDERAQRQRLHLIANNTRFLVPPWIRVKNLASKILALNLRRLSRDWEAVWKHPVLMAETFVDTSRFAGTCYRAANWICLGETAGRSKRGYVLKYKPRDALAPKALYVYPLHRRACRLLRDGTGPAV